LALDGVLVTVLSAAPIGGGYDRDRATLGSSARWTADLTRLLADSAPSSPEEPDPVQGRRHDVRGQRSATDQPDIHTVPGACCDLSDDGLTADPESLGEHAVVHLLLA
jgi:hypothetical protein